MSTLTLFISLISQIIFAETVTCTATVTDNKVVVWTATFTTEDLADLKGMWTPEIGSFESTDLSIYNTVTISRRTNGLLYGNIHTHTKNHCSASASGVVYQSKHGYLNVPLTKLEARCNLDQTINKIEFFVNE